MNSDKKLLGMFIFTVLLLILNFFMFPKLLLVHVFALVFMVIAFIKFSDSVLNYLYFTTIVFGIINFSLLLPIGSRLGIYYFYVTVFLYFCIIGLDLIRKKFKNIKLNNKYVIFCVIFLIYLFGSILISSSKLLAVKSIINYLVMIFMAIMFVMENKDKNSVKRTFVYLTYVFAGILVLGTAELFGFRYGVRNHYTDMGLFVKDYPFLKSVPVVFFYNPNNYGIILVLGMILLLISFWYTENKKNKIISGVMFLVAQINLIFTTSRTAWITLILTQIFIAFLFIIKKNYKNLRRAVSSVIVVLVIFFAFSCVPGMEAYYGKFYSTPILRMLNIHYNEKSGQIKENKMELGAQNSISERYTLMRDVVNGVIKDKHFLGFGPGNTVNYIKAVNNTHGVIDIHSLWFEILGDFGIFIFIYFLYIYARMQLDLIFIYKNSERSSSSMYYLMLGSSIFSIIFLSFAPSSIITFPAFWMFLGIAVALIVNKKFIQE